MIRTIFVPVGYAEAADRIADLVERGVIRIQPHWLSREACQSFIDSLPSPQRKRYAPTAAVVQVAGGAGRGVSPFAEPASTIERHGGVRVSGKTVSEARDAA